MTNIRAARIVLELEAVNRPVEKADLKKQFRMLCFKYHPDRCRDPSVNANEKFSIIREAYDFLNGTSTSFADNRSKKVKRPPQPPKPRPTASTFASKPKKSTTKGTHRKNIPMSEWWTVADENLIGLVDAILTLGLTCKWMDGSPVENLETAYKKTLLKSYLKFKAKQIDACACDKGFEACSIAYERLLIALDFEKHWDPPYGFEHKRNGQRKRENAIIAEYERRQTFLTNQERLHREANECKKAPVVETREQAERRAERAMEIGKKYGAMYSKGYGVKYKAELDDQRQRQINQQWVAQQQHANECAPKPCCKKETMQKEKRRGTKTARVDATNNQSETSTRVKRPRVAKTKAKAASGKNDDPIVITDSECPSIEASTSDNDNDEDYTDG